MTPLEEIGHLGDIPLSIHVELAMKTMKVSEILTLDAGTLIKTLRSAGDNIDILIGGASLGSGEIVIIEETVGVRITDFNEED
jgi:flagellar motor switch protein FliN/FliY